MSRKVQTGEKIAYLLNWADKGIPVQLVSESRKTARVSVGSRGFIIRLPRQFSAQRRQAAQAWAERWIRQQLERDPRLVQKFNRPSYRQGEWLELDSAKYQLQIRREEKRKTPAARLRGEKLELTLPAGTDAEVIARLISRTLAKAHLPEVRARVQHWNNRHFQREIGQVKLKYTRSRWGSCSSQGNINLSTRLLFAPQRVLDYVIVHELAHLVEMNHSSRFWALVAEVMPDYPEQERMLKTHQHLWDF